MTLQTNMLIFAVVLLAMFGAHAAFNPFGVTKAALEVDNIDMEARENNEYQRKENDENNFGYFLRKAEIHNTAELERIRNMTVGDLESTERRALTSRRSDEMNISCVEPHMFIRGNSLTVSRIKRSIRGRKVHESCRKLLKTDRLKYMNIFALNKIVIDDDIEEYKNLTIIAPKWIIKDKRRINLDGEDGKLEDTSVPADGKDGKPGNPGKPGANFFGIGKEFIGGENLVISVSGGNGSPGQNGGRGEKGEDGASPTVPNFPCDKGLCDEGRKINHLKCEQLECIKDNTNSWLGLNPIMFGYNKATKKYCNFVVVAYGWYYRIFGDKGKNGKDGGNGGKGGEGGNPGEIVLFELKDPSRITQINKVGSKGVDGTGGAGGTGGQTGKTAKLKCVTYDDKWNIESTSVSQERAANGTIGVAGKNTRNMQKPIAASRFSKLDKAKIINHYKSFLRENVDEDFKNSSLLKFLKQLEKNHRVKKLYDAMGFIDELKGLEDQSQNLKRGVNFLPFYESLLDRISDFANKTRTDKRVLAYLYTATLGRVHNLEDDLESGLVADITSYLESVKKDIAKLKDMKTGKVKEEMTNKYKDNYKKEIDKKIKDAEDLITKEIKPTIKNIEEEIDKNIEALIDEVLQMKTDNTKQSGELVKKEKQLEQALMIEALFSGLKIIGQVASLAGPVGAVAGSAIGIGTGVAESFGLGGISDDTDISFPDLEEDLDGLKEKIDEMTEKKAEELKNTLESASKEIEKNPKELTGLSAKVSAIKSKLEGLAKGKLNIKDVQAMDNELKNSIDVEKQKMKAERKVTAIKAIDKVQKAVQLASVVAESYNKYQKSKGKLDEVRQAIEKNEKAFDDLKKYEEKIYSTMVPMLDNMKNNLDDTISQLKSKSKVELHVTKWKVKSTLKDLMLKLEHATKSFNVSGSLKQCMEKLQDAMVALIGVQDYIEDYQKDQTLADFIAGVSATTVNDFDVSHNLTADSDLRNALIDLEITISSSIVIQRYKVAMNAFKQFVFPFAHIYLKGLMRPSHFAIDKKSGNKLDNIVSNAILNIDHIQSKLHDYKMSINKMDECSGSGEFKGKFRPFFVWKNEDNKELISKLLSGQEVIIKANVRRSPFEYDAIKFNHVLFYFKSTVHPVQNQINNALKMFKIKFTHLGDSHFRFGRKIYVLPTADTSFWYTFKTNNNGEPGQKSNSYSKLSDGDFMLSPYATWKVQLLSMNRRHSFKDLEQFNDTVNFALGGIGHWVVKNDCPDLKVDKYYNAINQHTADNSIAELNADDSVPLFDDFVPLFDDSVPFFDDAVSVFDQSVSLFDKTWSFF